MAVSVVQYKTTANAAAWATDGIEALSFDTQAQVGSFVVVQISVTQTSARTVSSVVDDGSNTYSLLTQGGQDATADETTFSSGEVWFYGGWITTAATTVTVTLSAAASDTGRLTTYELSGVHATTPTEDVAIHTDTTGTSHAVGPVVTAAAGSLVIGVRAGSVGIYTNEGGYTETDNINQGFGGVISGYKAVGAASTSWTMTTSGNESTAAVLIAIQPVIVSVNDARIVIRQA